MERERIELTLGIDRGVIARVDVRSSRALGAAQALTHHPLDEALELVPMLFALCGRAHRLAAVGAVEAALGVAPEALVVDGRAWLGRSECLEGHVRTMLLEWPRLIDERPAVPPFARLRRELESFARTVDPFGVLTRPRVRREGAPPRANVQSASPRASDEPVRIAEKLRASILEASLMPEHPTYAGLLAWAEHGASAPARVVRRVLDRALEGLGASTIPLSPAPSLDVIAAALAHDAGFSAAPTVDGRAVEVGPIAEQSEHPLVRDVVARHGRGLLARLAARVVAIEAALDGLVDARPVLEAALGEPLRAFGAGTSSAPTSRGTLVHHLALAGTHVKSWSTVAPTEWSFHPEGAVGALVGTPELDAQRIAEWHVAGLDPCVPYTVRVEA